MKHLITKVDKDSIADTLGVRDGWFLISIDNQLIHDVIDYEKLAASEKVSLAFEDDSGKHVEFVVEKEYWDPLGLSFSSGLMSPVRQCANRCVFCFVDQMPRGNRKTLYFKDDDWRLSLIMGNYVTLTNVSDAEFDRIIERRVAPLYISVHATDGIVREKMMRSKNANLILKRLKRLHDNGLSFHSQIVLCPGLNDGKILDATLSDLYALSPEAISVAIVPVGLTSHREGLYPLSPLTKEQAVKVVNQVKNFEEQNAAYGFAYCSDELYIRAGITLPEYEKYGAFDQIENGVGLFRLFEEGFLSALSTHQPLSARVKLDAATGMAIFDYMSALMEKLIPYNIHIDLHPVRNNFFGKSVTVSGLVTAGDIINQYGTALQGQALVIPSTMLRERSDVFLDGMTLDSLSNSLGKPVIPLPADDGEMFINDLFNYIERNLLG